MSRWPRSETVLGRHRIADADHLVARKLDQLLAPRAVEVIVLRVAVVMLVDGPAVEHHLPEEAGLDHLGERAIDRRPAGAASRGRAPQFLEELLRIEVLVPTRYVIDDRLALPRDPLAAGLQEFGEPLPRREGHLHGAQRKIGADGHRHPHPVLRRHDILRRDP